MRLQNSNLSDLDIVLIPSRLVKNLIFLGGLVDQCSAEGFKIVRLCVLSPAGVHAQNMNAM